MKTILEQWDGKFEIDDEIEENLDNFNPEDGEEFHIKLLPDK
jgi:hypothetical protein